MNPNDLKLGGFDILERPSDQGPGFQDPALFHSLWEMAGEL